MTRDTRSVAPTIIGTAYLPSIPSNTSPVQVMRILRELYRTIKPGGRLRIIVPDIRKAVEYYQDKKSHPYFHENFPTGCEAIWYVTNATCICPCGTAN
ncbi:MAG: hypothetical protein IPJ82_21140 [Lewinellaceae bacterium]|nr:hypothetical protein [Lewinellaceae bacterium]